MTNAVPTPDLSVVIPALDEAEVLPLLLRQLQDQRGIALEVIVADGGSTDGTPQLAAEAGARVLHAPRGRGAQMNAGSAAAQAPWLLFLHADSALENGIFLREAVAALQAACKDEGHERVAGHFPLRFQRREPGHEQLFRYLEAKTALNRPYTINGDQGLLIARAYFEQLGGFDSRLPFFEDQRIAAKIFATGRWIVLPGRLVTSARRFETEGHGPRHTLMALMMGLYGAGLERFFEEAPGVYARHAASGRLDLRPFVALIRRRVRALPPRERWRAWRRFARFARQNLWQPFLYLDLRRGGGEYRWLTRYDRFIAPLLANPAGDAFAALAAWTWFRIVLPRQIARWQKRP